MFRKGQVIKIKHSNSGRFEGDLAIITDHPHIDQDDNQLSVHIKMMDDDYDGEWYWRCDWLEPANSSPILSSLLEVLK